MAGIPEHIIDQVQDRVDIVEVIGNYIPLKKAGRNFKTNCPFHHEKTASFMVSQDKQIFHCFGCFPAGSFIKTENGFHSIEDVKIGQLVLTHQGRFMPVIRTLWRPYVGEVIDIYTRKSSLPVTLTSDHEIFVIKTKNCKYKSKENRICQRRCKLNCPAKFFKEYKIQKVPAIELAINDYLLYPINKEINEIKFINLNKYYNRKISNFGPTIKSIPTNIKIDEKFLRLIGYWIAEGSNHRAYIRFSLGNHESGFAKEIKGLIESVFHIKASIHIRKETGKTGLEITACNSKLANIFENLCGKGAANKHIPFELQKLTPQKQEIILKAIFKGDGFAKRISKCKRVRKYKIITTISLVLTEQLKDILLRMGISPTLRVQEAKIDKKGTRHKTTYRILWQDDSILHFSDIIQIDKTFYQISPTRRIVKKNFNGDVYNLTVAKDHSYTTSNFVVGNCGVGGNVFNFLMKYERLEFPEAVRALAQKAGVAIPDQSFNTGTESSFNNNLYAANEMAVAYFQKNLKEDRNGKGAYGYLRSRGLDDETINTFKLGYAASGWDGLLNFAGQKGVTPDILEKAGLAIKKQDGGYFDRFRSRIMFPIYDMKSRFLGFGGRVFLKEDEGPKYMNSPETSIYNKGRNLYGLNLSWKFIRDADQAVIVEGYLDLIVPFQMGVKNLIASLGTSLTEDHIRLLGRYTKNAIIIFDPDKAGEFATLRSLDLLIEEDFRVGVVRLPEGFDPDTFIRKHGPDEFRKRIAAAKSLFDYKMSVLVSKYDRTTLEGKAKIVAEMLPTIARVPNAVLKSGYMKSLADSLSVEEGAIREELKKIRQDYSASRPVPENASKTEAPDRKCKQSEKILAGLLMDDNNCVKTVRENLTLEDFKDPVIRNIVEALFRCHEESRAVTPGKLITHLSDTEARRMIPELVDCIDAIIDKEKTLTDCVLRIKQDNLKEKLSRLQIEIVLAQDRADEEKITKLIAECNILLGSIKAYECQAKENQNEAVKT